MCASSWGGFFWGDVGAQSLLLEVTFMRMCLSDRQLEGRASEDGVRVCAVHICFHATEAE